jgi:hypothetical protein
MKKLFTAILLITLSACTSVQQSPSASPNTSPNVEPTQIPTTPSAPASASPTSTPKTSSGSITWVNTEQQYSITYPSSWYIYKNGENGVGKDTTALSNWNLETARKPDNTFVRINIRPGDFGTRNVNQLLTHLKNDTNLELVRSEVITLNGMQGVRIVSIGLGKNTTYYLIGKNRLYELSFGGDYAENTAAFQTAYKVVSTFKEVPSN